MTVELPPTSRRRGWRTWAFCALFLVTAAFGVVVFISMRIAPPALTPRFTIETGATRALGFTPDGARFVFTGDRALEFWDVAAGRRVVRWPLKPYDASSIAWAPDGSAVAVTAPDGAGVGVVHTVLDGATGRPRFSWTEPYGETSLVSFTEDSSALRAVRKSLKDQTYTVEHRSAVEGKVVRSKTFPGSAASGFLVSAGGGYLVDLNLPAAGEIKLIDADDGREVFSMPNRPGTAPTAVAIAPGASALAVARDDGTIDTVEIPSGRLRSRHSARQNLYRVLSLAFSPDGRNLAVSSFYSPRRKRGFSFAFQGGSSTYCSLLDSAEGRMTAQFGQGVPSFSPDGRTVAVSASYGGLTRFYNVPTTTPR